MLSLILTSIVLNWYIQTVQSHEHLPKHRCIHDTLNIPIRGSLDTITHINYDDNAGRILDKTTTNLRITPVYQFQSETTLTTKIKEEYMPAAICLWQHALSAKNPIQDVLLFDRRCTSHWQDPDRGNPCASMSNEPDTCGDEATLDDAWMKELTACAKYTSAGVKSECTTKPKGTGFINTDFVIIVKAIETETCIKSPSTMGYAHACKFDQYDRPLMGFINFCPKAMTATESGTASFTAMHELAHALGFSANTWPRMRKEDGKTPRTIRDENDQPPIVENTKCSNGETPAGQRPSASTTLKVSESRGNPNSFTLVTPSVRDAARKHFGCNTAEGVELENQPTGGGCWGSHWDERILHNDLMAPIGGESAVLSSITLAAFADMGFYNVNIDLSSRLEFGNNLGCTFITDPCISKDGVALFKKKGYFCNEESETSCTPDRKYKAKCNVVEYNMAITPTWFQHFGTDSKKGGR